MRTIVAALFLVSVWVLSAARPGSRPKPKEEESTLRLLHAVWRHGNRNPESGLVWEGNSYADESHYPEGFGQLTNKGKLKEYELGKFLRKRYDSFLGDTWDINIQDFRSTDVNRTKMSGLLVMAGLWPPKGSNVWTEELHWQPIPYNYEPISDDPLLVPSYCSTFSAAFAAAYADVTVQAYLAERYGEAMEIVSANTGISTTNYYYALLYYDTMKVQEDLGFELDEWTSAVYPEPLKSLATDFYYIYTNTTALRQILAGTFIKKIIGDTESFINGTLSPESRKFFPYSAHDLNVGTAIRSLDAYELDQPPPYGSSVLFEVHEIKSVYGFKLYYVDYSDESPRPLSIPGCDHFCPFDDFVELVSEIIPTTDVCNGE